MAAKFSAQTSEKQSVKKVVKTLKSALNLKTFTAVLLLTFCVLMLVNPSFYLESARKGLTLFSAILLPSLFPFYFCALLLTKIGAAKVLSALFEKPFFKLYRTPKESAYVMLLSMISGYPVGASCLKELYLAGVIDTSDVKAISAFASTSGPVFMLGTLGNAIFGNLAAGAIILVSHYIAAFLNGFFYKKKASYENQAVRTQSTTDNVLAKSMERATFSMLIVGGYIVICGMIVDTLSLLGVDKLILSTFGSDGQPLVALLFGMVEMTRGGIECAKCAFRPLGVALATAIVSFGGLSVTFQNHTFLASCGVKFKETLARKFTHCAVAFVLAFALAIIFKKYI
ncbi:MAG: hypothetical protein J5713_00435 [Clostridia bacterium]|nr:hypothetical protein [Clostridia bacterium]